jgi:chromosome segregation ATPase
MSELESKLKESKKETETLRSKLKEMQPRSAKPRSISETEEKITRAQTQLKIEIEKLKGQIAKSIPKTAEEGARVFDSAIAELRTQLGKIQEGLAQSLPRTEIEQLKTALQEKIMKVQTDLANSIAGEPQHVRDDMQQLKSRISELEKELEAATRRIKLLETPRDTKDTI